MSYHEDKFKVKYNKLMYNDKYVEFFQSPNVSRSKLKNPKYLILHYTAGPSLESSINWFKNSSANASSQFLIDFDGKIIQGAKLNQIAWHAGKSYYKGINGLNSHSIGIEMVNYGHMDIIGDGVYRTWFGKIVRDGDPIYAKSGEEINIEIVEGTHPIMGGKKVAWMLAPPEQIESTVYLGSYLMKKYNLKECLPHEKISRGRKWDTGMTISDSVFSRIESRDVEPYSDDKNAYEVSVNTYLNMRAWPALSSRVIAKLENNKRVELERTIEQDGFTWGKIKTFEEGMEGWVALNFLNKS